MEFRKSWHETIPVNLYDPYQVVFWTVAVGRITWLPLALSHLREYFVITIRYWIDVFTMFNDSKHTLLITWNNIVCKILELVDSSLTQTLLLDSTLFDTKTNTVLTQTMTWQVLLYLFCSLFSMSFFHVNFAKIFFDLRALNQQWERYNFRLYQLEVFFLQILLHTFRQRKLHYGQYVLNDFRNFSWKFYCFKFACFFISSGLCFLFRFQHTVQSLGKTPKKRMKV